MNIHEAINKTIPIFFEHKNLEDENLINELRKENIPPSLAKKLVIFMPHAFGRVIVKNMGVIAPDEYVYTQKKKLFTDEIQKKLNDEPVFVESFEIASSMAGKKETDEAFLSIALRSAEVRCVNEMKLKGSKPENIVLTPLHVLWELDEELPQDNMKPTATKNWWEFWK